MTPRGLLALTVPLLVSSPAFAQNEPPTAPAEEPPSPPSAPEEPDPQPDPEPAPSEEAPPSAEGEPTEAAPPADSNPTDTAPPAQPPTPPPQNAPAKPSTPAPAASEPAPPADPANAAGEVLEEAPDEEITVGGSRLARAPGSAHVIGRRQLERFEYDDSQAILLQVPGVYVRQEDGIGLRPNIGVRGVSPDRSKKLTLTEDGILFGPAPYSAPAAYYFPVMTRMTQVRVIKGPSAIAYGPQTVGGAVDLISRPIPTETGGALDVGLGEYGYGKAHAHFGSSDGQTGFLLEGVRLQNSGFMELPSGADTGSTRNEWMAKASHVLDPAARVLHEFRVKLTYTNEVSNETYLGKTEADFRASPYRRYAASALDQMKFHRTGMVLTHAMNAPDSALQVTTSAYRNELTRAWNKLNRLGPGAPALFDVLEDPDAVGNRDLYGVLTGEADSTSPRDTLYIGPNARDFVSQGIQTKLDWATETGALSHRVEAGLRLHHDEIRRRHSESGYLMSGGRLVPDGQAVLVTRKDREQTYALAAHVLDAVTWQQLTVTPGVRVELIRSESQLLHAPGPDFVPSNESAFGYAVLPGIGAFYGLTDELGVLGGVHRGFSPPPPGVSATSNGELSVNYEGGARYKKGAATAEVIGFFSDYQNLTNVCTFAGGCTNENVDQQFDAGAAHVYGLEAFLGHELPAGPLTVPFTAAYTLTRSEFRTSFNSGDPTFGAVQKGDEMPYLPRHQLVATLGAETKTAGAALAANYISAMREEAGAEPLAQTVSTDPQFWLDVSAHWRALGFLTLYANLRNLTGAENIVSHRPYGARPNAPRWLQVGAKFEF